ncbi:MAG: LytR C-terminal domain-containing protein [Calditrichaeota bacterium]|nr:LytR C-terminal domain-containing protein [Calditrichota bacterium]
MAKRVRRDLSNKKVRQIVKKKLQTSRQQTQRSPNFSRNIFTYLKPLFYFFVFALFIFILYQITTSLNFTEFFSSNGTEVKPSDTPPLQAVAPPRESDTTESQITQPILTPVPQNTQVEVLNGCGVPGIAKSTTAFLRHFKFDVVYMGNYSNFNEQNTRIIDRIGNINSAMKIAETLGVEEQYVTTEVDKSKQLNVTVILGKDYKSLKPFKN